MPFDTQDLSLKLDASAGTEFSHVVRKKYFSELSIYRSVFKRLLDVTFVLLSLVIILPVIAIISLFVALDGHAPIYTQLRVGRNGKTFHILKIRTMVYNADALLEEHLTMNPELREEWDATQKLKHDIRVTRIGRFLRKSSLDELPQLFNVLTGSMSLVGPRPMMVSQKNLYPGQAYYRLRPGVTGFWQVSERNNCKFSDRSKYDASYEQAISLKTDLSVQMRTIVVVLRGTGH